MKSTMRNFICWYQGILQQAFNVRGRASRYDWYMFAISALCASLFVDYLFMIPWLQPWEWWPQLSLALYALIMLVPLSIRRLHDTNRSGWELLWLALPVFGWLYLLILFYIDGSIKENQYGASTKSIYDAY